MSRTRGGCRADTRKLPPATARAHHDKPQEAFMDLRKITKLIDLLEESNLAEIEIKEGEESVRLARTPSGGAPLAYRSAERRVGKECGSTYRSWWWPDP